MFDEQTVGDPLPGPAHVAATDFDGDGDLDLLVAAMGLVLPSNDRIGQVIVIENLGASRWRNRVRVESIARVTDVRAADLNDDGRLDLVDGQFGDLEGEIRWMENLGDWNFRNHLVSHQPGTIMTPVADFDADGRLDFAALISHDEEEVHLFPNGGAGVFEDRLLWKAKDQSWGNSGIEVLDLNRDGRPDLVATNGDGFNTGFTAPAPWHGLQWFENRSGRFTDHRIGTCRDVTDRPARISMATVTSTSSWCRVSTM